MSGPTYKGYRGSVEYEDGQLVISILHISDTITTNCVNAAEVNRCFAELVEDYIATCKAIGKEPEKPFKGSFNIRIGPDLHKAASQAAGRKGTTLNAWICEAITAALARENAERERDRQWLSTAFTVRHAEAKIYTMGKIQAGQTGEHVSARELFARVPRFSAEPWKN